MEKQDGSSSITEPHQLGHQTEEVRESNAPSPTDIDLSKESENEHVEDGEGYVTGAKLMLILGSITFVAFLFLLDVSIVSTAIPKITTEFHSLNDVGWYGSAYLMANCALQPLTGKIYTYVNSKWVYLTALAIFELGSLLCGAAQSSTMLIVGRAVAGVGGSGLLNGAYTIISASAPLHQLPVYVGIHMGVAQIGMLLGPVLGGVLTQHATWRWCFYMNLPCGGLITILILFIHIPDRTLKLPGKQGFLAVLKKVDFPDFVLFAPAIIQLILALQWGGALYAWNSATIIGLFCGSFCTFVIFLAWEYRIGEEAMVPFSIIGRRAILCSCLNMAFVLGCLEVTVYYLPIYFQSVHKESPTMSGVNLLATLLSSVIFLLIAGGLVQVIGYYVPFAIVGAIISMIGCAIMVNFSPSTKLGMWVGYQVVQGAGGGLSMSLPILAVNNNCPKEQISVVSALLAFCQNLGGALFLSFSEIAFNTELRKALVTYAPDVDPETVIEAGASAIRSVVPPALLSGVLVAYSKAFDYTRYVAIGAAGGALLTAFGMGWINIKKPKAEKAEDELKSA